jgi:DNA-binding CsgD family transcriptional regulator
MNETEQLGAVVAQIYDAAFDPSLWKDVLKTATHFLGGSSAALFSKNAAGTTLDVACHYNVASGYGQLYADRYIALDPCAIAQCSAAVEEPTSIASYVRYDEFLETRFYREWVRPQRIVDVAAAVIDKSATSVSSFGVFRDERDGLVDHETHRRTRLLAPHIRRAILVGRATELKNVEAAALADTLDGLRAAVFLIDAGTRLVHANAAARLLLAQSNMLSLVNGRLTVSDMRAGHLLRAAAAAAGDGDLALAGAVGQLSLMTRDGRRYVAHLLPLTAGARRRAGRSHQAALALFVQEATLETRPAGEVIGKSYALTPTELRVLLSIVDGGGVPECAEALGIADSTVKTHLSRLFEKTGCRRQADLVRLVAAFSSPLPSPSRSSTGAPPAQQLRPLG